MRTPARHTIHSPTYMAGHLLQRGQLLPSTIPVQKYAQGYIHVSSKGSTHCVYQKWQARGRCREPCSFQATRLPKACLMLSRG